MVSTKKLYFCLILLTLVLIAFALFLKLSFFPNSITTVSNSSSNQVKDAIENKKELHPLSIEYMRTQNYVGSDFVFEQELSNGVNYKKYIVSYLSDNLKIYGLLTIPVTEKPLNGYPAIIFNHGYIPPAEYKTTERYVAYLDAFAKNGYIVFKPDYRGHGNSQGEPLGAYYSPAYTIDVLNALASVKKYKDTNPGKIGMWGHSMGGHITIRSILISNDIKVGVIWGGVVASYSDMLNNWHRSSPWTPSAREQSVARPNRQKFIDQYGTVQSNPEFWNSIDITNFVSQINVPIQLHHGNADDTVPFEFSKKLHDLLVANNKVSEYFEYQNGDHNISSPHFEVAIKRSVEFFDRYLK